MAANFLDKGTKKFTTRHEKRLKLDGDYVEMQFKVTVHVPYIENWCARMRWVGKTKEKRTQGVRLVGVL